FEIYYETHGTGAALVLIPGFASGAWNWFCQISDLAQHFQVITFDPRGVSRSQISAETRVTISTIADDVANLLEHLNIKRANILGASFGGFVAQEFALKYEEKLDKLILACTSFGGKNHVAPTIDVLLAFASTENLNSSERIRKFMIPAFTPDFVEKHFDEVKKVCRLREQNVVPEAVYLAQLQSATSFDAEQRVSTISAQTLILTGGRDLVVPPQNAANLARAIPNSTVKVIADGGHLFFIEKANEFNQAVIEFLQIIGSDMNYA
ncbi:MAG: alpha/beta hydrolase, partial [Pyrinomonadaceae bacterium]